MATSARVQVLEEVAYDDNAVGERWVLCLQWCRYIYDDGNLEEGYRFIWRKDDGKLQAARGQARIPSLRHVEVLMKKAKDAGWGDFYNEGEKKDNR